MKRNQGISPARDTTPKKESRYNNIGFFDINNLVSVRNHRVFLRAYSALSEAGL